MAAVKKKETAKKTRERKPKTEKKSVGYSPFISTVQKDIILKHKDRIEEICRTYQGIDECPFEVWKELDAIVIEVGKAYYDFGGEDNERGFATHIRIKPKKRANYTITQRVREMERKKFILGFCERLNDADEEYKIHYTNLIFGHIAIWLEENGKVEKDKD